MSQDESLLAAAFLVWFRQENYVQDAIRTESQPNDDMSDRLRSPSTIRLLHAAIGKATEAGELLDALKKHIFYGKPLDIVNIQEEVGDGFWYDAIICDVTGVTFQQIQERNIAKLRKRYPEKFVAEQAINRDLDAERKVLEGKDAQTLQKEWAHSDDAPEDAVRTIMQEALEKIAGLGFAVDVMGCTGQPSPVVMEDLGFARVG